MNGYHPTITAAVAAEHRSDLLRAAARSQMIADLPDRARHQTPRRHPSWWARTTSFLSTHRVVTSHA
jgi:hypothetical protein